MDWGNTTATIRYHQAVRANLFFTGLAGYSRYQYRSGYTNYAYDEEKLNQTNQFILGSSVRDWIARGGLEWHVRPAWQIRAGIETIVHQYVPSVLKTTFTVGQTILATTNQPINSIEQAVYGEQEWRPSSNLTIQPGLRLVGYRVGTKTYPSVEPRLGVNWTVWDKLTLKAGYSKMRQFVHLLNSNAVGLPNDIWVPATANVAPQRASQLTAGLATSLGKRQTIQVSVEGYYKWLNDLTDVATGASLLGTFDESWEKTIEKHGQGRARGIEVMLHKPTGRLNGWMAYTYAKNERQFSSINEGRWFRANFDRRHVGNLVVNYQLRPRVSVSSAWQYQSGQPTTVPVALVRDPANSYYPNYVYGGRNNFQMPSYHRLDLSLAFDRTTRRHHTRTWTVGVINAYNRRNPLFLRLQNRGVFKEPYQFLQEPIGYRSTLLQQSFFPVLPYLSYSIKL